MMKGGAVGAGVTACLCLLFVLILYTDLKYSMNYAAFTVNKTADEKLTWKVFAPTLVMKYRIFSNLIPTSFCRFLKRKKS